MTFTETDKLEAEKRAREANALLHKIRDAERLAENKGLLGKTFRMRNDYSCPEKPSDYWWVYAKVQKVGRDGMLTVLRFDTDKYGAMQVQVERYQHHMAYYTEITPAAFNKAWRAFQKKVASTKP